MRNRSLAVLLLSRLRSQHAAAAQAHCEAVWNWYRECAIETFRKEPRTAELALAFRRIDLGSYDSDTKENAKLDFTYFTEEELEGIVAELHVSTAETKGTP